MRLSIISFTLNGSKLCKKLHTELATLGYETRAFAMGSYAKEVELEHVTENLREWTGRSFATSEGLVFIGAVGIAVRAIAPFIKDKSTDPAVIVIDEKANYVIPLLSGHIGGANDYAKVIADSLGAVVVITTATDLNQKFAVDVFAKQNDLYISNMEYAKRISAAVLNESSVGFESDFNTTGTLPSILSKKKDCEYGICISLNGEKKPFEKTLNLVPKIITLGIGCKKGKTFKEIESVVLTTLKSARISIQAVRNVATIDLKKNERGLLEFCEKYGLEFITYSAEVLDQVVGTFEESDYVKSVTGVGNVCERASLLGSKHGIIVQKKIADHGVTVSLARKDWSVKFE